MGWALIPLYLKIVYKVQNNLVTQRSGWKDSLPLDMDVGLWPIRWRGCKLVDDLVTWTRSSRLQRSNWWLRWSRSAECVVCVFVSLSTNEGRFQQYSKMQASARDIRSTTLEKSKLETLVLCNHVLLQIVVICMNMDSFSGENLTLLIKFYNGILVSSKLYMVWGGYRLGLSWEGYNLFHQGEVGHLFWWRESRAICYGLVRISVRLRFLRLFRSGRVSILSSYVFVAIYVAEASITRKYK